MPRIKKIDSVKNKGKEEKFGTSVCLSCGSTNASNFYMSYNRLHKWNNKKLPLCKNCIEEEYNAYLSKYGDGKLAVYYVCRALNVYFSLELYNIAFSSTLKTGQTILQTYFKYLNSFHDKNGYKDCFDDSKDFLDIDIARGIVDAPSPPPIEEVELKLDGNDKQNMEDVIRLLSYDPFENENPEDRKYLYNKLIDFLDESTLDDSFKIPIVIEIVKGFNQVEKINKAIALINTNQVTQNIKDLKDLMDTRTSTLRGILAMAKDNGISVNYAIDKSKGAGTLSGIIKSLQEQGITSAEINLYNIETCDGMKQVADISNKSILSQLSLSESDYVDMIKDQKILIQELDEKSMSLEEENRILKVKLKAIEEHLKEEQVK